VLDLIGVLSFSNVVRLKAVSGNALGQVVGFVAGDIRREEGLAWISTIGVLPEYRGQGIGAALLRACEERLLPQGFAQKALPEGFAQKALPEGFAQKALPEGFAQKDGRRVKAVRLCVRRSNEAAIRLYDRFGYAKIGEWSGYYQDGEAALVLEKRLGGF
jgi:ribosomal protein S18 acetylase RimI-like enzyme